MSLKEPTMPETHIPTEQNSKSQPAQEIIERHLQSLKRILDGPYRKMRREIESVLQDPIFTRDLDLNLDEERNRCTEWCLHLGEKRMGTIPFPKELGGRNDLPNSLMMFENLAYFDTSLLVKFGVQMGLFCGSIYNLGTEYHHQRYLPQAIIMKLPGCFAMTETGHGSNVRELETTATYDPKTQEFIIHTPTESARKDYIGNAAKDAVLATVFAQLWINNESQGVHAFVVPIRDESGTPMPGVTFEDCGHKMGLNGIDNGRIYFEQVRIPRENLLDRFGQVSPEGDYHSPIKSRTRRFFSMLATLVTGRAFISISSCSLSKQALTIAIRYAHSRRQFGDKNVPESPLIRYQTHQVTLMPFLAATYALHFTNRALMKKFVRIKPGEGSEREVRKFETFIAGMKGWSSWLARDIIQVCRESCGGAGYLSENLLPQLKANSDIFTTFEGANVVLYQLVTKNLLADFKEDFGVFSAQTIGNYLNWATSSVSDLISYKNYFTTRSEDSKHLLDSEFHHHALRYREKSLLGSLARRMQHALKSGKSPFNALLDCQDHFVQVANAYTERTIHTNFLRQIESYHKHPVGDILSQLCKLFALWCLYKDRAFFLESDYFEPVKSKAVRNVFFELCHSISKKSLLLVESFAIPENLMQVPIAPKPSISELVENTELFSS